MTKSLQIKDFDNIRLEISSPGLTGTNIEVPLFVLHSVAHVMNISLPISTAPSLKIIFEADRESPICYRAKQTIYLAAELIQWSRIAYQFTHELCHYVIPEDVHQNFRWLEESICELSSYYFLPKISKYWRRTGVNLTTDKHELYYPYFTSYVENNSHKANSFDFSSFASDTQISQDLKELMSDCEIRDKNAYIANNLLPIFQRLPKTWQAIPFLCYPSSNLSFRDFLEEWIKLSPIESRAGLCEVARLFGAKNLHM